MSGKAHVMKIRCFPAAVTTTATLALWISLAPSGLTQEIAPPAPSTPTPAAEQVKLSRGAADVLKLSHAKVNEEVTLAFIQNSERRFNLTASEILYLRKEGVSDRILTAMLSQPGSASATPPQPPAPAPTAASEASAPQYINQPASSSVLETTPVYVTTPAYYSFYDPWPYYAYTSPTVSFGLYWGWGWGWGCGWNSGHCGYPYYPYYGNSYYCHNGYYPGYYPPYSHYPPYGNPPPNGNRPGQPQTLVNGRPVNPFAARGGNRVESRSASPAAMGSPTSFWSNNGNSPTARSSESQAGGAPVRRSENRSTAQLNGGTRNPNPTSVWNNSANQRPTAPAVANPNVNPNTTLATRSSRSSFSQPTTWSQPSSQPGISYAPRPTMNYQSSSFSPAPSYRSGGSFSGASRPSMSPSFSSGGGNPMSSMRGGGSFSGASAPRMSPGGEFRGGGGRSR